MPENVLRELRGLIRSHTNRHIDEWKAAGKPVVGFFCQYIPPELVLAAGALPLRLRGAGSEDSSTGDAYMSSHVCTYVRHVMSLVLEDEYRFLDGFIGSNTCDHVRRTYDLFQKKTTVPFQWFVSVPRTVRKSLFSYYYNELQKLKVALEDHFQLEITPDRLREAIARTQRVRDRLRRIDALRLPDRPKLSGTEAAVVHLASHMLPPEIFVVLADRLLESLEAREPLEIPRARLMLIGAELDEPDFVAAIESQGARVVADNLCFGSRSVLPAIVEDGDNLLKTLAETYFFRLSCARMIGNFPDRWEELKRAAHHTRADGVVFQRLLFCDPWGADLHNLQLRNRKENAFPVLALSREYGVVPTGQVKTRVQAFVEKIEITRAKGAAGVSP